MIYYINHEQTFILLYAYSQLDKYHTIYYQIQSYQ